jgi:hypothetical protein
VRDGVGEWGAVSDVRRVARQCMFYRGFEISTILTYTSSTTTHYIISLYRNIRLIITITAELRDTVNTLHPHTDRVLHHQPPRALPYLSLPTVIPCACVRVSHGGLRCDVMRSRAMPSKTRASIFVLPVRANLLTVHRPNYDGLTDLTY